MKDYSKLIAPAALAAEIAYVEGASWWGARVWRSARAAWRCARLASDPDPAGDRGRWDPMTPHRPNSDDAP